MKYNNELPDGFDYGNPLPDDARVGRFSDVEKVMHVIVRVVTGSTDFRGAIAYLCGEMDHPYPLEQPMSRNDVIISVLGFVMVGSQRSTGIVFDMCREMAKKGYVAFSPDGTVVVTDLGIEMWNEWAGQISDREPTPTAMEEYITDLAEAVQIITVNIDGDDGDDDQGGPPDDTLSWLSSMAKGL